MFHYTNHRLIQYIFVLLTVVICFPLLIGHASASLLTHTTARVSDVGTKVYLPVINHVKTTAPNIPVLISPYNGEVLDTLIPTFVWDMGVLPEDVYVGYCLAYGLSLDQLDRCSVSGGGNGIHESVLWNLEPDTVYYWRVGYLYEGNFDDIYWSQAQVFTSGPSGGVIPPIPILESPANGSVVSMQDLVLDWADVADSTMYRILVFDFDDFRSRMWETNESQIDVSDYAWWFGRGENYGWFVYARNEYAWSPDVELSEFRLFSIQH